jgi:hypothetical protein
VPLVTYRPQPIPAFNDNQPSFAIRAAIHPPL